jgi:hypothetical protein
VVVGVIVVVASVVVAPEVVAVSWPSLEVDESDPVVANLMEADVAAVVAEPMEDWVVLDSVLAGSVSL